MSAICRNVVMNVCQSRVCARAVVVCAALVLSIGCQSQPTPTVESYIPDEDVAQRALVAVLDAWQADRDLNKLDDGTALLLVDARRRVGDRLGSYRIVGPQPWDRGRRFVVELTLQNEETPQKVRFVILGKDPLMVFRQEDFDMLANWMHPMDSEPPQPPSSPPPPKEGDAP